MSCDIRMFRNRGIVRDAGSKEGDRYARLSSAEAIVFLRWGKVLPLYHITLCYSWEVDEECVILQRGV